MSIAFVVVMPFLMLFLVFFLADIEARHLTQRRVNERPSPVEATSEGQAPATA
ncbi:hypothetical protein [Sporichthya sp.]|uniref:hypothetical protein n=1 Tax=Sporichthya sp. TaxID=65475 RepID=UPI001839949B|nr:hypothetical protein [Sporichthya sp.]MBA3743390.1 hypothetical protein [Sporichthya sp.]